MEEHPNKSARDIFEETPSWYEAPILTEQELDPNVVPPQQQRLGETAGMGALANSPKRTGMEPGRQAALTWLLLYVFLGGGALLFMIVNIVATGVREDPPASTQFAIGDCVVPIDANNALGATAGTDSCNAGGRPVVGGTFEAVGFAQMPSSDEFWDEAIDRCVDISSTAGIPFPLPAAATDSEWEAGNQTIVCAVIPADQVPDEFAGNITGS